MAHENAVHALTVVKLRVIGMHEVCYLRRCCGG